MELETGVDWDMELETGMWSWRLGHGVRDWDVELETGTWWS